MPRRFGPMLGAWAAIYAVSLPGLALLALSGLTSIGLLLAVAGLSLVLALLLARIWMHDLACLLADLRQGASDAPLGKGPARHAPYFAATRELAREIERLTRLLAENTALVARMLRADAAIVERLPDPLIVLGADRSVRRANRAARQAFGSDIAAVLRHPGLRAAIDRAFAGTALQSAALSLSVPVPREVAATVIPLDPPLADGGRAIAVLSDRTRERAVERMRADFVANASHELRTPLASLIGFIDTLRGPARDDPAAQTRFLAIMSEQAERMNRLIDDLLSLSRIELSEHQPPSDLVAMGTLLDEIAAGFEPRLAARRISLQIDAAETVPDVLGDTDQLAQVLQNLLDNAIKYGREGGSIRVVMRPVAPNNTDVRLAQPRPGVTISVADDGPGIARAHIPRLTERFYRVDAGRSRAIGGTGLGLAIVKHIINRHRGALAIDSELGAGACFTIWLPRATPDQVEKSDR